MSTMIRQFSLSTNILNDSIDSARYILTSNVQSAFDLIATNYSQGIRSFNLIGAYGTGKSTFLSAFEAHINDEHIFLESRKWTKHNKYKVIKLVGEYHSLLSVFADYYGCDNNATDILKCLDHTVLQYNRQKEGVLIIIDEFGKYLEYAAKNDPERELYFLQQLAEFANTDNRDLLLITTLHQDFSAYSSGLNKAQRNEWIKVKGRFKEVSFNEPVEQLIYMAGKRLSEDIPKEKESALVKLFKTIETAKVFPLRDYFNINVAKAIYPLDMLSSSVLALSLQQYGQNERSLFTFLDSYNYLGIQDFDSKKSNFYSVKHVYDYLNYNFNSFLKSKANPDYSKWAAIRIAIERIEGEFEYEQQALHQTIVKTIGLLNVFSHSGSKLDLTFLSAYIQITDGFNAVDLALKDLERKKIIRYNVYAHRYILFDSTDVDIDVAIEEAASQLSRSSDVVTYLSKYFSFPTLSAKRIYFEKGTPRIFQYKITENPYHSSVPQGEIDGYINLIFNSDIDEKLITDVSRNTTEAILYGVFKNTSVIKELIEEIQKAEIVKERHLDDRVVQREISQIIDLQKHLLNHHVLGSFYNSDSVSWYFSGDRLVFDNSRNFNSQLSRICREVYSSTPTFRSELANRSKLSGAVSTARKSLIRALISKNDVENLGITGFPPEKSIYMSLLKQTRIHKQDLTTWVLSEPDDDLYHFRPLFAQCDEFISSSKGAKRSIMELYEILGKRPFKLKKGFLDFWIPIFLFIRSSDFALYGKNGFVPEVDEEVLELLVRNPKDYGLKAFDVGGVKVQLFNQYRQFLNLSEEGKTSSSGFIQTIVPFMKFYKDLPEFAKQTKRLNKQTLKIRQALVEATDPEKLFFEQFPNALDFDIVQLTKEPELLKRFSGALQEAIKELRSAYDDLQLRFENIINSIWNEEFSFLQYKDKLRARYSISLKQHLLLPYQKTFYQRLCSPLEDRSAWLSSIAQATIGKTLDKISDYEEIKLHESFLNLIHELDNLNDIAIHDVNLDIEDVFKVEISTPGSALNNKIIRIPKKREEKLNLLQYQMKELLVNENKFTKIAILAELLKRELDNEGN